MEFATLIVNANLPAFSYNPFGNVSDQELAKVIVPRVFLEELLQKIEQSDSFVVELVGAKGRGKTTHLRFLHQIFPQGKYFDAKRQSGSFEQLLVKPAPLLFIDSIHQLSLRQRLKLYRHFPQLVLTTHLSRSLEYLLVGKQTNTYRVKGLQLFQLKQMIENRMRLAGKTPPDAVIHINEQAVKQLIHLFKDDIRGIMNHLYDQFEKYKA